MGNEEMAAAIGFKVTTLVAACSAKTPGGLERTSRGSAGAGILGFPVSGSPADRWKLWGSIPYYGPTVEVIMKTVPEVTAG